LEGLSDHNTVTSFFLMHGVLWPESVKMHSSSWSS